MKSWISISTLIGVLWLALLPPPCSGEEIQIGQKVRLFLSPQEKIIGFLTEQTFDKALVMSMNSAMRSFDSEKLTVENFDAHGYDSLINAKKAIKLEPNTRAVIVGAGGELYLGRKLKILTGPQTGKIWWVTKTAVHAVQ